MSAPTAPERQFALVVKPTGLFEVIDWPAKSDDKLPTLYKTIGCDRVDVVRLTDCIEMWVDDEGMYNSTLNEFATRLYSHYQPLHQGYYGTCVFTGGVDEDGDSIGLDLEHLLEVLSRYLPLLVMIKHTFVITDFPRRNKN